MDDISKMFLEMVDSIVKILLRPNCSLDTGATSRGWT